MSSWIVPVLILLVFLYWPFSIAFCKDFHSPLGLSPREEERDTKNL